MSLTQSWPSCCMLVCLWGQKVPVIYKADCRVACQLAVPPKVPGWPVCVYTGTGRVSASRLFDYEWSMLRQQNAQRTTSDAEQRANSDLAWSSLVVIPWLWLLCLSDCCVPTCIPPTGLSSVLKQEEERIQHRQYETHIWLLKRVKANASFICWNKNWVKVEAEQTAARQNRKCIPIFFYSSWFSPHLHPLLRFKLQPIHGTQILSRGVCVSFFCSVDVLMVRAMRPEWQVEEWAWTTEAHSSAICVHVCASLNTTYCRSADCC